MKDRYIQAKDFKDFCANQDMLIKILNHRMTNVEGHLSIIKVDVNWTKKLLWAILGVICVSLFSIIFKSAFGI